MLQSDFGCDQVMKQRSKQVFELALFGTGYLDLPVDSMARSHNVILLVLWWQDDRERFEFGSVDASEVGCPVRNRKEVAFPIRALS